VFVSADRGRVWKALDRVPEASPDEIIAALKRRDLAPVGPDLAPPAAFAKCNACHGWTDPALNQTTHSLWLMPPNRRDWSATVRRMTKSAKLTDQEARDITDFLTRYAEARRAARSAAPGATGTGVP
jgi:cytochrome c1